jgi:hypothetical protein
MSINKALKINYFYVFLITGLMVCNIFAGDELYYRSSKYSEKYNYNAKWIWYPEKFINATRQTRYFQKTFKLDNLADNARIWVRADDKFSLQVNGHVLNNNKRLRDGYNWQSAFCFNIKSVLKQGNNEVKIAVTNGTGPAGLLCRIKIKKSNGTEFDLVSNETWKTNKGNNDKWETPRIIGDVTAAPWGGEDITPFVTTSEFKKYQYEKKIVKQELAEIEKKLLEEKKNVCNIIYDNGTPFIKIAGKSYAAFMYKNRHLSPDDPKFIRKIKEFKNSGCHFFCFDIDLKRYWLGPNQIKTPDWNQKLLKIIRLDPEAHFMIGIDLFPPSWWLKSNTKEWIGYATGKAVFDISSFKRKAAASYASNKWRQETGKAIEKLIKAFENIPAGRRIFAYRLNYGIYGEWHYFGMKAEMPDTGEAMTKAFRVWLKNKYKNQVELLRKAWNNKTVTFDTAKVPGIKKRSLLPNMALYNPACQKQFIDYQRCHQQVAADCQLYFNKIAKDATNNRALIGNYSGYFFGMNYPAVGWHLETDKILNSPATDFQVSPYCYSSKFRNFGGSAQIRAITETYRLRGKLSILEADTRTHLNEETRQHFASTPEESVAQLSRDFCNAFINGVGIWYFDFGYNWYNDPSIYQFMREIKEIMNLKANCNSASEVAVVCDFESIIYNSTATGYSKSSHSAINGSVIELAHSGVPYDTLLLSDLGRKNIKNYKVYLFPNLLFITPDKKKIIDNLKRNGKTLIWLYAPGFIAPDKFSIENASKLTGINLKYFPEKIKMITYFSSTRNMLTDNLKNKYMPRNRHFQINTASVLYADDPKALSLGTFRSNNKTLTSLAFKKNKGYNSIYCATPFIGRKLLQNICKMAGVHIYNKDCNDVVYANKSFVALHTKAGGHKTIYLPKKISTVKQLLPDQKIIAQNVDKIEIQLPSRSTTLLYLKK